VDAHTDPDLDAFGPKVRSHSALDVHSGSDALARRGEHGEKRVPLGVDLLAFVGIKGVADQPVVVGEDTTVGVAQALQLGRRALDVGEEESKRLRGNKL